MFSAYSKELLQILTSKRCIEWPKLYFLLLVKAEHSAMKIKLIFQDVPFCHHVPLIAEFCPNAKHSPPFHQRRPTDQLHRSQMPANTCSNVRNASVGHWKSCPVLFCAELCFCSPMICFSRFGQEMCPFMQFRNRHQLWSCKQGK